MNTPAVCQHAFSYDDAGRSTKVFKLSFEYLHIYSPKSGDFCRKK